MHQVRSSSEVLFVAGDARVDNATPDTVAGDEAEATNSNDADALEQLTRLAQERQARSPGASFAECFAQVYREHAHLAAQERNEARKRLGVV